MKQTLIIACGTLESGGAERMISVLSASFLQRFDRVEIYTWRDAPVFYQLDERIRVVSIPQQSGKRSLPGQMFWFRKQMKVMKPSAVLSFLAPFNMLTLLSLWKCGVPVLIAERNDPRQDCPNVVWRKLRNILYGFSDRLCVQTKANKDYFPAYIRKKTDVIYNPVFLPSSLIGKALETPKEKTIVSVGRLTSQKNFKLLLEAFAEVVKSYPDYKLIIYGDGELKEELIREICFLSLKGKVELAGVKKNIHDYLISARLFVMSSDYEGMSNALIEAMSLGLPCISTQVSGATDLIQDGINGRLVNIGDRCGLTAAISDCLHDVERTKKMAKKGIEVTELLSIKHIVGEWFEFIRKGSVKIAD